MHVHNDQFIDNQSLVYPAGYRNWWLLRICYILMSFVYVTCVLFSHYIVYVYYVRQYFSLCDCRVWIITLLECAYLCLSRT